MAELPRSQSRTQATSIAVRPLARADLNHLAATVRDLKAAVEQLQGQAGLPASRALRLADALNAGLVRLDARGDVVSAADAETAPFDDADQSTPPAPTGLAVAVSHYQAALSWRKPVYRGYLWTEVWELAAPAFRTDAAYAVGDFTTYALSVYRCTSAHSPGAWNAGHFTAAGGSDLVVANAQKIATVATDAYHGALGVGAISHFWVRAVTQEKVAGPFNASAGVAATAIAVDAHTARLALTASIDAVGAGVTDRVVYALTLPTTLTLTHVQAFCVARTATVTVDVLEGTASVLTAPMSPSPGAVATGTVADPGLAGGATLQVTVSTDGTGSVTNLTVTLFLTASTVP